MLCVTKVVVFFVNFILLVFGLAIVIIAGIYMSHENDFGFIFTDNTFFLPILSMGIGTAMVLLCPIGYYGALKENRLVVKVYGGLLIVLLTAQLVVGILITVNASVPVEHIQTKMNDTFSQYGHEDPEMQANINSFQREAECCGVRDYSDWGLYPFGQAHNDSVPDSCCREDYYKVGCGLNVLSKEDYEDLIFDKGCSSVVTAILIEVGMLLGNLCIIFVSIELVSVSFLCGLSRDPKSYTQRVVIVRAVEIVSRITPTRNISSSPRCP